MKKYFGEKFSRTRIEILWTLSCSVEGHLTDKVSDYILLRIPTSRRVENNIQSTILRQLRK